MVTSTATVDYSPAQWRSQILAHRDPKSFEARRRFAAAEFVDQANAASNFVDVENLLVVLLYEDAFHNCDESRPIRTPLRLMAYRASRVPHGIQWGGAENGQLVKDLTFSPQFGARRQRIDRSKRLSGK